MRLAARRAQLWIRGVLIRPLVILATPLLFPLASLWRRILFRTTFVAVTGSLGKTTAKEVLARFLALRGRTYRTIGTQNGGVCVPVNVLRVRPWHRFAVIELGIAKPDSMRKIARAVRPDVAILVSLARVHTKGFPSFEEYAAEKALLLDYLAPGGLAVLNGDDPRVAAMAAGSGFQVRRFGASAGLDLWADQVSARWPDRLSFRVHDGLESCDVRTQQLGTHWIPALLAAMAAARHVGVGCREAASVLSNIPPYTARMEPVRLPSGTIIVRDDYSASIDTFEAALRFLREARAGRRILVLSDVSDSGENYRSRLRKLGVAVAGWLDLLVLIGREHRYGCRKAVEAGMPDEGVRGFETLRQAAGWLKSTLGTDDLVLLKGRTTDHVTRLFFAQIGSVSCWRDYCRRTMLCDGCWELGFRPEAGEAPPSVGLRV